MDLENRAAGAERRARAVAEQRTLAGQLFRAKNLRVQPFCQCVATFTGAILRRVSFSDSALEEKRGAHHRKFQSRDPGTRLLSRLRDAEAVAKMDAKFDLVDLELKLGIIDFKRTIGKIEDTADTLPRRGNQ